MLLQALRGYQAATSGPSAIDDYWYTDIGAPTAAGVGVTPEMAMKTSAVYACVRLISESVAGLPIFTYRRLSNGGRMPAPDHPLYDLLHDQPCDAPRMSAFQFKATSMAHLLLHGNAYAEILPGRRGVVDQLKMIHPRRVTPEIVGPNEDVLRYQVRQKDGRNKAYNAEDIFHQTGLSLDGITGVSVIKYARETVGLTLAAENYAARVFSNDATPRGVLEHPGVLSTDAIERLRASWAEKHAGQANAHKPAILEEGMQWKAMSMSAEDAQLLSSRQFQVVDVARWFNVPLHMLQSQEKSTSWGSGIAEMSLGFVVFSLLPWMGRWEATIQQQLMMAPRTFFAEFKVDALLRGNIKDRFAAYAVGRQWGWLSVNDILRLENLNPIGPEGDIRLQPLNMVPLGTPPAPPKPTGAPLRNGNGAAAVPPDIEAVDYEAGARLLREIAQLTNGGISHAE